MFQIDPKPFKATVTIVDLSGEQKPLSLYFKPRPCSTVQAFFEACKGKPLDEVFADLIASVDESEKPEGQTDAEFLIALVDNYPLALGNITDAYVQELFQGRQKN